MGFVQREVYTVLLPFKRKTIFIMQASKMGAFVLITALANHKNPIPIMYRFAMPPYIGCRHFVQRLLKVCKKNGAMLVVMRYY